MSWLRKRRPAEPTVGLRKPQWAPHCPVCGRVVHAAWWDAGERHPLETGAGGTTFWHTRNPVPPWWGGINDQPCRDPNLWALGDLLKRVDSEVSDHE